MGKRSKKKSLDVAYPHDKIANDLFSDYAVNNYKSYLLEAEVLRSNKTLSKSVNDIDINFKIDGKYVLTNYSLHSGEVFFTTRKFNSIFANNDAVSELILELARAEVNANLASTSRGFQIHEFPGFGYITSTPEQRNFNYRLRQILKKPLLTSITARFR